MPLNQCTKKKTRFGDGRADGANRRRWTRSKDFYERRKEAHY
jgi:hypothetical protein